MPESSVRKRHDADTQIRMRRGAKTERQDMSIAGTEHQTHRPSAPACAMVIFGANGDLTSRLIVPSLYNLCRTRALPDNFFLIGISRTAFTTAEWIDGLRGMMKAHTTSIASEFSGGTVDDTTWTWLSSRMRYMRGDFTKSETHQQLRALLEEAGQQRGTGGNALFYLATADRYFAAIVEELGKAGLTDENKNADGVPARWRRVVIEKPFGHDVASAHDLNRLLSRTLTEDQTFRIDHFLGKNAVQSILALRFANGMFESIWNRDRIDHVQITVSETVGVEDRAEFYEATGALRDMVPSHICSLIAMMALEPPVGFDASSIRDKMRDVFAAMPAVSPEHAVRGQYDSGTVSGRPAKAYRAEPKVDPASNTETFVAMRFEIDNWRWAGVPFYIRTGKHMAVRSTEIAICFRKAPYAAFQEAPVDSLRPNWLVLRITPDEGISLQFDVKRRGPAMALAPVTMDFHYQDWFQSEPNVGYEVLLYDVMTGDQTLFIRADIIQQTWRLVQPVLDAWSTEKPVFPDYASGGQGPAAADMLLARDGNRAWRPLPQPPVPQPPVPKPA